MASRADVAERVPRDGKQLPIKGNSFPADATLLDLVEQRLVADAELLAPPCGGSSGPGAACLR